MTPAEWKKLDHLDQVQVLRDALRIALDSVPHRFEWNCQLKQAQRIWEASGQLSLFPADRSIKS